MNDARLARVCLAVIYASIPLYPSFITFTSVTVPGVALVPRPFAVALLALNVIAVVCAFVPLVRSRAVHSPLTAPLVAMLAAAVLSSVCGFDPRAGAVFIGIFGLSILWHLVVLGHYGAPGVARAIFWAYLLAGTLAAIVAIVMIALRVPAAQYAIGHGRAIGTFVLSGELAGYLIIFLPIALALARHADERALRVLACVAALVGSIAMLLTFSRAGWMGLACAGAFFVAVRARARRTGLIAGGAVVLVTLAAIVLLFNVHHNPSENFTRLSIWQAALQIIDRFPLTGVGPFAFSRAYDLVRAPDGDAVAFHAHSLYLTFLAELGVVGFAALVWTGWSFGVEMCRRLAQAGAVATDLALAIVAGLVGTLAQGAIDTVSVVIFGLLLSTMALALAAVRFGMGARA